MITDMTDSVKKLERKKKRDDKLADLLRTVADGIEERGPTTWDPKVNAKVRGLSPNDVPEVYLEITTSDPDTVYEALDVLRGDDGG